MSMALIRPAISAALAGGPQHGYGLLRAVESITLGQVSPPIGSLYRVIDAMARDQLIEADHEEIVDGRLRRYYRLTEHGRAELAQVSDTMSLVAVHAREQLGGAGRGGFHAAIRLGTA